MKEGDRTEESRGLGKTYDEEFHMIPKPIAGKLKLHPSQSHFSTSSSSVIDSRAGQIFSPVDATKPAVW